ncbi:MAG: hypothetical protein RIR62_1999 [Pseudomonadota bacterium]|jgi:ActR/RegA family two-component response regulator
MGSLQGRRILIVEDDFFQAEDLARALEEAGATVEGPAGSLAEALDLVTRLPHLDHAILDVTLRRARVDAVADILRRRAVPFCFLTGAEPARLVRRYGVAVFAKPAATEAIIAHLAGDQPAPSRASRSAPSSALPAGGSSGKRP